MTLAVLLPALLPVALTADGGGPLLQQSEPPPPASVVTTEWDPDDERAVLSVTPLDGGETRAIQTSDRQAYTQVEASPDGERVAYVAHDGETGLYDLMVTPIDGGTAQSVVLGSTQELGNLAWTPDGATLAVDVSEDNGEASIYTVPSGGGPLQELAAPEDYAFEPEFGCSIGPVQLFPYEWSPDGSTLLLGAFAPCWEVVFLQVAVVSADGTGLRRLAAEGEYSASPDWSPDGQRVVFDSDGELFSIGVNGEGLRSLGFGELATWGPHGDIASVAASDPSDPSSYDLMVGDEADPQREEVSDPPARVGRSQWSPDGRRIVYASQVGREVELAVVDVPTRQTRPLSGLGIGTVVDFTVAQRPAERSAPPAAPGSRYGGEERYETAALISQATSPTPPQTEDGEELGSSAVLVSGEVYPDALTGSYLAGYLGRHFLLTARDRLPEPTIGELDRLRVRTVTIVGGPAAVSPAVEQELRDRGIDVDRAFGEDRYETAFRVAAVRDFGLPAVFLVSGVDFPDALSAGAWAYELPYPVLLTTPEGLHPQAEEALWQAQPGHVYVVGGPSAVSDEVMRQATMVCDEGQEPPCRTAERIAGGTRYSTAIAVADRFSRDNPIRHVNLARGDSFPDALAGAAHSGDEGGATLFTASRDELGAHTEAWLREHADTIETVDVFGSPVAISDEVWERARQAAD